MNLRLTFFSLFCVFISFVFLNPVHMWSQWVGHKVSAVNIWPNVLSLMKWSPSYHDMSNNVLCCQRDKVKLCIVVLEWWAIREPLDKNITFDIRVSFLFLFCFTSNINIYVHNGRNLSKVITHLKQNSKLCFVSLV